MEQVPEFKEKMNSLLGHMKSFQTLEEANQELEVEEKATDGIRIHNLKSLLIGFMRQIESLFTADTEKNKDIIVPFTDICQVCYLFYWGLYPSLYVINGSGEDGDEYHCNGVLVMNITDGRFNYLNIYDANNPSKIKTLNETWDKHEGGLCIVESMCLPDQILKNDKYQNIFESDKKYNFIFRCGGKCIETFAASNEFSVIVFRNNSNLLTKVDPQITKQLQESSYDNDIIIDSLNAFEIDLPHFYLPKIEIDLPQDLQVGDDELTGCSCTWSDKYGLIVSFIGNFIFHFDWFGDFKWKQIDYGVNGDILNDGHYPWLCLCSAPLSTHKSDDDSKDADNLSILKGDDEYLFVSGMILYGNTNTKLYSFKTKEWKDLDCRGDVEDNQYMITSCVFDRKRQRIYCGCLDNETNSLFINFYDFKSNKWNPDLFPTDNLPKEWNEQNSGLLFLDKLFGDRLYVQHEGIYSIDLNEDSEQTRKWERCDNMDFSDKLAESPMHSEYTFERLIC